MAHQTIIPPFHKWKERKPDSELREFIYLVMILGMILLVYILLA